MPQISHRDQLLEGAIQCLRTKGYARTTARDIASAANGNLASIGYHFGSKEALLNEAIMRACEEWTTRLGEAAFASGSDSPLEQMGASWVAMLDSRFRRWSAYRWEVGVSSTAAESRDSFSTWEAK